MCMQIKLKITDNTNEKREINRRVNETLYPMFSSR